MRVFVDSGMQEIKGVKIVISCDYFLPTRLHIPNSVTKYSEGNN